jgi:hypothetical protein
VGKKKKTTTADLQVKNKKTTTTDLQVKKKKPTTADLQRTIENMHRDLSNKHKTLTTELSQTIEVKIEAALSKWKEEWKDMINTRVKEVVGLELEEVKADVCMLEASVHKLQADSSTQQSVHKKVDKLENTNQSLKGEIRKVKDEIVQLKDTADRLDAGNNTLNDREEVDALTRRMSQLENLGVPTDTSTQLEELRSQVTRLQEGPKGALPVASNKNIVIKNLPVSETQDADSDITVGMVEKLLKEGLKMDKVEIVKAERKRSRNGWPGIITVTLDSVEDKKNILKAKRGLRSTENYKDVFIEPELSFELRQQQRNSRLLLSALGRDSDFKCVRGTIVRRKQGPETADGQRP